MEAEIGEAKYQIKEIKKIFVDDGSERFELCTGRIQIQQAIKKEVLLTEIPEMFEAIARRDDEPTVVI